MNVGKIWDSFSPNWPPNHAFQHKHRKELDQEIEKEPNNIKF
jgi:hypothetical protein